MKRLLINIKTALIIIYTLFASANLYSQDSSYAYPDDEYSSQQNPDCRRALNMISTNPLRYFDFYQLSYYRKISCNGVAGLEAMLPSDKNITGWGASAEYRHYFFHKPFPGFYLAPRLAYYKMKSELANTEKSLYTVAFIAGWQFVFSDRWTMGAGFGVEVLGKKEDNKPEFDKYSGTSPFLRLELGLVW